MIRECEAVSVTQTEGVVVRVGLSGSLWALKVLYVSVLEGG